MFSPRARKTKADELAPPRWKTMIASGLAIYPLILLLPRVLDPLTAAFPQWAQALIAVLCITPIATLIMLPAVNWVLQRWLYKTRSDFASNIEKQS